MSRFLSTLLVVALAFAAPTHAQITYNIVSYHGVSHASHQASFNNLQPQGYRLISLAVAELLAAVADGEPGWTTTRVLGVLLRVCEAMAFAHARGVVHRDLKPSNIMVGRFGETYVMDWGLARVLGDAAPAVGDGVDTLRAAIAGEDGASPLLTQQGDVVGTPAYMAPEQAMRGAAVGPAADIYAVGAILYHLLSGSMPYAAGNRSAESVLAALRRGPPARRWRC